MISRLLVFLFLLTSAGHASQWPATVIDDPELTERRELLLRHGIAPDAPSLLDFLRNGFRQSALPRGLPTEPMLKGSVVNAAIVELGVTAQEAAIPTLIGIVEGNLPSGAERIILRDFESLPLSDMEGQILRMNRMLALNSIVALGLIGDPAAESAILTRMTREGTPAFVFRGALALGQMGSNKGFSHAYRLAREVQSEDSPEAFRLFYILTGRNYGVTANTSLARRRQLVSELGDWYMANKDTFQVQRGDVMRRMRAIPMSAPLEPGSLRGILRKSRDINDFDGRLAARRQLMRLAPDSFTELQRITEDPLEDLDIRRAAMSWLAASDSSRARRIIRRLRSDENPLIAQVSEQVLRDIENQLSQR